MKSHRAPHRGTTGSADCERALGESRASVNRITTGVYNVNFSENFDDANYMFTAGGYQNEGQWPVIPVRDSTGIVSVSGYQIVISSGTNRVDPLVESVHLSFLGG